MIRRNTLIILAVFIVLLVVFIWIGRSDQADSTPTPTDPVVYLFDLEVGEIQKIIITGAGGENLVLMRGDDATWTLDGTRSESLDQDQINSTLEQFINSRLITTLNTQPPLAEIGLDPAIYVIEIELINGEDISLQIGEMTAIGTGYYVRKVAGELLVVNNFPVDALIDFLQNPPLLPTPTDLTTPTP